MNKIEIHEGIYRQNVYNINLGDNHYSHVTCYFDKDKNILALFKAGENTNMTNFIEDTSIIPLLLPKNIEIRIKEILLEWTYDHIESIPLYKHDTTLWDGIFEITKRDEFVISLLESVK